MDDRAAAIENLSAPFTDGRPSVLDLILSADRERGDGPGELTVELPQSDEEGSDRIRFVAGALDAILGGRDRSLKQTKARAVVAAITKAVRQPSLASVQSFYRLARQGPTQAIVDEVLERIAPELANSRDAVAALSRRLVAEAPDVEAAKMGIALLGVSGGTDDEALISQIGLSDEFTLYSVVALANLFESPERAIWRLAQRVYGWGRIAAVERLSRTQDADIKRWLLLAGFRNAIMNEYLACIAATTGELLPALQAPDVDNDLLASAAGILDALISGGPAEQIEDYPDGAAACVAFLRHALDVEAPSLDVVSAVRNIGDLAAGRRAGRLKALPGWTTQVFLDIRTHTAAFMQKPGARAAVETGLLSDAEWGDYFVAAQLAPSFGIDPWPRHLDRQRRGIGDNWWHLMQTTDAQRVEQVLALARAQLDLDTVGSGPTSSLGLGLEFKDDSAVDFIVQDLRRFPGIGWDIVKVGLRGRSVRLRNMAINALRDWGRANWPADAEAAVKSAMKRETESDVRGRMADLLAGRLKDV